MANPEHLEILAQGVEVWNAWRRQPVEDKDEDDTPDLSGADLSGVALSEVDFSFTALRGADLEDADLEDADLSGAELAVAKLSGARLGGADLAGANLIDADLSGAELIAAVLIDAVLMYADLSAADLRGADLRGADLRAADLRGAILCGAVLKATDLAGADLRDVELGWTALDSLDLRRVKGLETIRHLAPSSVGLDTLELSRGEIPPSFLRGAGVPRGILRTLRRWRGIEAASFLVCSDRDGATVRELCGELRERDVRCWVDERSTDGEDERVYEEIERGARRFDRTVLCVSASTLAEDWLGEQVQLAAEREGRLREDEDIAEPWLLTVVDLDGCLDAAAQQDPESSGDELLGILLGRRVGVLDEKGAIDQIAKALGGGRHGRLGRRFPGF